MRTSAHNTESKITAFEVAFIIGIITWTITVAAVIINQVSVSLYQYI